MRKLAIPILVGILALWLTACGTALTPIPPTEAVTQAAFPAPGSSIAYMVVDTYLRQINEAQSVADLSQSWALLTNDGQCNPQDKCELSYFQENWWPVQMTYWLYDCSPTAVMVELHTYKRGESALTAERKPTFLRFELVPFDDVLYIDDIRPAGGIDATCTPLASPS
jgi:hypothetical protein